MSDFRITKLHGGTVGDVKLIEGKAVLKVQKMETQFRSGFMAARTSTLPALPTVLLSIIV